MLLTDTTMRDAHQSLLATRTRTHDMLEIAPHYARLAPELFSLECWGGATFDVAMRFLGEGPWQRLAQIRAAVPNVLLQMLLRASNAVGYTNYPDNVVRFFVQQAAKGGIDVFRVFDSLNSVENMRVAMDAVRETGALCEAAICYTGDLFDARRSKYDLAYYVRMAKELEKAGAHAGDQDMAGVCRPRAASALVKALEEETGLPIHFHTHDTSGLAGASVLAAIEAGCDIVDGALDAMSGLTSQPNLGSIVAALEGSPRDPGVSQRRCAACPTTGKACAATTARSRARSAAAPPTSTATRCPAASTPTCASRPARWAWSRAGPRWPRPAPRSTCFSATSSRSPRPPRWWATWRCSWSPTT